MAAAGGHLVAPPRAWLRARCYTRGTLRLALGLTVHTGWATAVLAGGGWEAPVVVARERVELLGEADRFLFHKAAEMTPNEAQQWVLRAKKEALARASAALTRMASGHGVKACAVVAKKGAMLALEEIVRAHPKIHTAEGCFYRDVLLEAGNDAGMQVTVIAPTELDAKDPRLVVVGKVVGRPWTVDWKLAVMAAWKVA